MKIYFAILTGSRRSMTRAHIAASFANNDDRFFAIMVYDRHVSMEQTLRYCHSFCHAMNWNLVLVEPDPDYKYIRKTDGIPTQKDVQYMSFWMVTYPLFTYLKELKKEIKDFTLITDYIGLPGERVNFTENMTDEEVLRYMQDNNIPDNPVVQNMCIPGNCLCMAVSDLEKRSELKELYPKTLATIDKLPFEKGPIEEESHVKTVNCETCRKMFDIGFYDDKDRS